MGCWLATSATGGSGWNAIVDCSFYSQRQPGYYIWSSLSVVVIMECMALLSFVTPREHLGERQSWLVALLLSMFALKFAAQGSIPQVPYLTMYDKKLYLGIITIFLITLLQHTSYLIRYRLDDTFEHAAVGLCFFWTIAQNVSFWATAYYVHAQKPASDIVSPS